MFIHGAICHIQCAAFNSSYSAGRGAKEANLYTEIAEGIHSYGVTRHRHGKDSNFKPSCTILSCITAKLTSCSEATSCQSLLLIFYVFYKCLTVPT